MIPILISQDYMEVLAWHHKGQIELNEQAGTAHLTVDGTEYVALSPAEVTA